jgi:hypothetical protein
LPAKKSDKNRISFINRKKLDKNRIKIIICPKFRQKQRKSIQNSEIYPKNIRSEKLSEIYPKLIRKFSPRFVRTFFPFEFLARIHPRSTYSTSRPYLPPPLEQPHGKTRAPQPHPDEPTPLDQSERIGPPHPNQRAGSALSQIHVTIKTSRNQLIHPSHGHATNEMLPLHVTATTLTISITCGTRGHERDNTHRTKHCPKGLTCMRQTLFRRGFVCFRKTLLLVRHLPGARPLA